MNYDKIYKYSPYYLRNILITLFGLKLNKQRYGSTYKAVFQNCLDLKFSTPEQILLLQNEMLRKFVAYAKTFSKYYQNSLKNINVEELTVNLIKKLPVLEKDVIRNNLSALVTDSNKNKMIKATTSGTTGTPISILFKREDFQARMAILDYYRSWYGVKKGDRRATFTGRILKPDWDKSKKFWQMNYALNQRLYSSYHLSSEFIPYYINDLNKFRPEFIDGYPSALAIISRYIKLKSLQLNFVPKVIFTTAENLKEVDRTLISETFKCPVKDQYASAEGAPFVVECEEGKKHFLTYTGVLEIVDHNDAPSKSGQILVTAFHTHGTPLIRYRIGDNMTVSDLSTCSCGMHYPIIESIDGRDDDFLISKERGLVGRFSPSFKKIPSAILKTQMIQNSIDEIEVLYVPDKNSFKMEYLNSIEAEIKSRIGNNINIKFIEKNDIPCGKNGKFRPVICKIKERNN